MKKILLLGSTSLLLIGTLTNAVNGQEVTDVAKLNTSVSQERNSPGFKQSNSNINSGVILRGEISTKAIRNFMRNYPDITNASWSKSANGLYMVYFKNDGIQNWTFYNNRGDCEYSLRHYTEEQLSPEVRHLIKSRYYDFSIYHVSEVSRNDKIAYVIKLEDKTLWKTVKVIDGEIEIIVEYAKK